MRFLRPGSALLMISLLLGQIVSVFGQSVTCPDGFVAPPPNLYTGYCYRYITATQTWNAHENDCSRVTYNGLPYAGGHLATLFNQNSALVVMNNYCNNLNQGQSHYFVGYYCVSSSYSSRTDWRWSSGMPTTWLHNSPTYLSGAEPDDAGCGRAHYSDDGANTGRIGDWVCSSPLSGGCCEAPVVPTPSASTTGTQTATSTITSTNTRSNTPTQTATSTMTASSSQTGTMTGTVTMTRTGSKSSTETRTSTMTSTATMTATSTGTSTVSPSETSSSSVSVSVSASTSSSVSSSQTSSGSSSVTATVTASASVSPSFTKIRAMWFPQSGLNNGGSSAMYLDENGVWVEDTSLANEGGTQDKIGTGVIIGVAVGAGLCLCCCLMGALWFCIARKRKKENERKARERLNRKSHMVVASTIKRGGGATSVASTLGVQSVRANGPAMMAMFNSMNPALIKARRGTVVGGSGSSGSGSGSGNATGRHRNPRMTTALAAFKPTMISKEGSGDLLQEMPEVQEEPLVEDTVIGIDDEKGGCEVEEAVGSGGEEEAGEVEEVGGSGCEEGAGEVGQEEDAVEDDDYVDEDDAIAAGVGRKINGRSVANGNSLQHKQKNGVEMAVAPTLEEPRKLVIGKGAVMKEHVQKQTVMLRRVSKVRGDKELTALRQETVRFARPSMAGRGLYEPQASHRNLLGSGGGGSTPYAFTATVSRVIVKEEKEDA